MSLKLGEEKYMGRGWETEKKQNKSKVPNDRCAFPASETEDPTVPGEDTSGGELAHPHCLPFHSALS